MLRQKVKLSAGRLRSITSNGWFNFDHLSILYVLNFYYNRISLFFTSLQFINKSIYLFYINYNMETTFSDERTLKISEVIYNQFKSVYQKERLDPSRLEEFKKEQLKHLYPHVFDGQGQIRKYSFCEACGSSPGSFCCCDSHPPEKSFVKLGLGICLYFKFLKHSTIFYCLMSMLAILSCVVCYAVSIENGFNPLADYSTFFFSTTYGTFSSERNKCSYGLIKNNTASMTLTCPYGQINSFASVFSKQSLNSLYNCRNQLKKQGKEPNQYSTGPYLLTSNKSCNSGLTSCDIKIVLNGLQNYSLVSYTYECNSNVYNIGAVRGQSQQFFYFIVAVDLLFCTCYFIFLCSQRLAERREQDFFKNSQVSLNDFSIEIKGFSRNNYESEFKQFLDEQTRILGPDFLSSIASFTFPEGQQMMDLYAQQKYFYRKLHDLIKDFYFENEGPVLQFRDAHNILLTKRSILQYGEYKVHLKQLVDRYMGLKRKDVHKGYKNSDEKISLYVVFTDVPSKQRVLNTQKSSCCRDNFVVNNKIYYQNEPPAPDMIQWENRTSWTFARNIISWLITLSICVGSYLLFGFIQLKQNQLFSQYNYGIDCNVLYTSSQLSVFDTNLNAQSQSYLTCVCKNQSLLDLASDNNNDYCSNWRKQYLLYLAIPLLISLGIVIYNIIVSYIFKALSKFERYEFVTNEQLSYILKRAFVLIMNMGLIMILLNYNYNNSIQVQQISFIFLGKYDSFSSDWYINIGAIIILTMIFNIAFPIIELMFACTLKFIKKCWDKRCCLVPTSRQTKKDYIGLYSDDIFRISQRYAYLIATLIVSLAFSGIVPILTPVAAISFFLLYNADKLLMFKFFQTPINYDHSLHQIVIKTMVIGLIAHFALTAYFLSEPTLIAANSTITYPYNYTVNSGNSRINSMITTSYILPYVALFVLLVLFYLITSLIIGLFQKICDFCTKKLFDFRTNIIREMVFWDCLNKKQIDDLLQITEVNLNQQELRKNQNIRDTVTNSDKKIHQEISTQQNIIRAAQEILKIKKIQINDGQTQLLGLPSYEHLNKSNEKKQNDKMLKLQKQLREVMKSAFSSARLEPRNKMMPNESAENLMKQK